jgi:hypothetical protein
MDTERSQGSSGSHKEGTAVDITPYSSEHKEAMDLPKILQNGPNADKVWGEVSPKLSKSFTKDQVQKKVKKLKVKRASSNAQKSAATFKYEKKTPTATPTPTQQANAKQQKANHNTAPKNQKVEYKGQIQWIMDRRVRQVGFWTFGAIQASQLISVSRLYIYIFRDETNIFSSCLAKTCLRQNGTMQRTLAILQIWKRLLCTTKNGARHCAPTNQRRAFWDLFGTFCMTAPISSCLGQRRQQKRRRRSRRHADRREGQFE